jgi:hypothetical protein
MMKTSRFGSAMSNSNRIKLDMTAPQSSPAESPVLSAGICNPSEGLTRSTRVMQEMPWRKARRFHPALPIISVHIPRNGSSLELAPRE